MVTGSNRTILFPCHADDGERPKAIRVRLVRDEVIAARWRVSHAISQAEASPSHANETGTR